ncbi:MAG: ABC transporter ATP-binding protein [Alphaproteobacteria bacterium]|nr:ABC transporter ATP-binding protein [Alphaproteobacteria bacterium]
MTDAIIEIADISKAFPGGVRAVDAVSLSIREGEFFALLGPSGCGKTTLLRMIAGFETPTEGAIRIDGVDMAGTAPNRRPVNMVFQSYAVFPHMSVAENVAYGLKMDGVAKPEMARRVEDALALVRLDGFDGRKPDQLSGGQRQRVALARALVKRPRVLLLDEPLSALDAKLREAMQLELVNLQKSVGITFVVVTHDQDEALSMADRIAVMETGQVRQLAPPAELYEHPNSRFVAEFIGKMNVIEATASDGVLTGPGLGVIARAPDLGDGPASVALRPEKIRLNMAPTPALGKDEAEIEGTVTTVSYHGAESHIYVDAGEGVLLSATVQNAERDAAHRVKRGDRARLCWRLADALVLKE